MFCKDCKFWSKNNEKDSSRELCINPKSGSCLEFTLPGWGCLNGVENTPERVQKCVRCGNNLTDGEFVVCENCMY
jgi:hypothetical protein